MSDHVAPSSFGQLDVLASMSQRIRAAQPVDPHAIERELEAGFGALVGLEAELSRVQALDRAAPNAHAASIAELKYRIEALREALTELRTAAVPPGEARIGYGFVLPGQHGRAHAHRN
jgi:cob(I)alamin adenosyltransferase